MIAASMVSSGNAAKCRRQDHHSEACLDPDQNDHEERSYSKTGSAIRLPAARPKKIAQRIDDADIGIVGIDESARSATAPTKEIAIGMKINDFAILPQALFDP